VWAAGGVLCEKDSIDYKRNFSNWWKQKWKTVKHPGKGTVFDYFVNNENGRLEEWGNIVQTIEFDSRRWATSQSLPQRPSVTPTSLKPSINRPVLLIGKRREDPASEGYLEQAEP
jgi:dynein heavy chain